MSNPVEQFARAAHDFCAWCAAPPGPESEEAKTVLRHLVELYGLALGLEHPVDFDADLDGPRTTDEEWDAVFRRCAALPVSYYADVLDPLVVPGGEASIGDVCDDLADIHRDLTSGLALYRAGHRAEAVWEWRESFQTHWGAHATSALRALHAWCAANDAWWTEP